MRDMRGGGGGGGGGGLLSSCSRTCRVLCLSTSSLLVMNYIHQPHLPLMNYEGIRQYVYRSFKF